MAHPPSPHAMTGNLSFPGKLLRSSGRKTTWPGDPKAGSDMTLYGPGIAFGAPSSGSVVATRSFLGGCAKLKPAVASRAAAADAMVLLFMRLLPGQQDTRTFVHAVGVLTCRRLSEGKITA